MWVAGFSYKTFVPSATKVGMCSGSPEYESIDETWDRARAWLRLVGKKHHKYNQPINVQAHIQLLLLCCRSSCGGGRDVLSHPQQSVARTGFGWVDRHERRVESARSTRCTSEKSVRSCTSYQVRSVIVWRHVTHHITQVISIYFILFYGQNLSGWWLPRTTSPPAPTHATSSRGQRLQMRHLVTHSRLATSFHINAFLSRSTVCCLPSTQRLLTSFYAISDVFPREKRKRKTLNLGNIFAFDLGFFAVAFIGSFEVPK